MEQIQPKPSRDIEPLSSRNVQKCSRQEIWSGEIKYNENSSQSFNLADNLKTYMKENKLNQKQLAQISGIQPSTLHSYLTGVCPKGLLNLIRLARNLDINLDDLIFNEI